MPERAAHVSVSEAAGLEHVCLAVYEDDGVLPCRIVLLNSAHKNNQGAGAQALSCSLAPASSSSAHVVLLVFVVQLLIIILLESVVHAQCLCRV